MRVIVQRVNSALVKINGELTASVNNGLLIFAGWEETDTVEDLEWMAGKIIGLRIFADVNGLMNLSLGDINGEILLVSQFTLFASTKKGKRPSFIRSAKPDVAVPLYQSFIQCLEKDLGKPVKTGVFGADMKISLENDGPVTLFIDSKNKE